MKEREFSFCLQFYFPGVSCVVSDRGGVHLPDILSCTCDLFERNGVCSFDLQF